MGNNSYQFRLQSLDVLDEYMGQLQQEMVAFNEFPFRLKNLHESYADSDRWNDIRHTEFFEDSLNEVILASEAARLKIEDARSRLVNLKNVYANAGVS